MRVLRITRDLEPRWSPGVAALEATARYPLGADAFHIDHGADYFAFFHRLGVLHYYAAIEGERVVGVGAGMLRQVPLRTGAPAEDCWYLADLKVHPDAQGRWLPFRMFRAGLAQGLQASARGYLVSMDPPGPGPNPLVALFARLPITPLRFAGTLGIYSLDAAAMAAVAPRLARALGPLSYRSLAGLKDLVLESTGRPLPLLHVQHGPGAEPGGAAPVQGHTHMFCLVADDPLAQALAQEGLVPSATASLLERGLEGTDWRFVLTSDI